jgi:hyperosmotically inducible protein
MMKWYTGIDRRVRGDYGLNGHFTKAVMKKGSDGTYFPIYQTLKGERQMNMELLKLRQLLLVLGSLALSASLMAAPGPQQPVTVQPPADNTATNKNQTPPTADQQKMNSSDRAITQKIRKAVHEDNSLSTYAHNIKIITQDGKVTLRGPVRSDEEKNSLEAKAVSVVGQDNVTNQLEVTPSK